jgi:tRNA(adenine34) deaminase
MFVKGGTSVELYFMGEALDEAQKAFDLKEVPIGAVVVKDGVIVGRGHNLRETAKDPTAHAEMIAIREASKTLGGWRLMDCDLYVTIEPCPMCAGAVMLSRIKRLIIGAMDPKGGAVGSLLSIPEDERFNHQTEIIRGIREEECSGIMKDFFREIRKSK